MSIKNLIAENNRIIINTDIDGVLSGILLTNYFGCKVVGFSNSDNTIWLDKKQASSIYDALYIDMFVPRQDVGCIDQHIVSVNQDHYNIISKNSKKINPNLSNPRFHVPNASYYVKYPFGTVHFIIAMLESLGIEVDLDLNEKTEYNLTFGDLLLRADDAMQTTVHSPYKDNAADWWSWLKSQSKNGRVTLAMAEYLQNLSGAQVERIKSNTNLLLQSSSRFACESPDGGFKRGLLNPNHTIKENVKDYFRYLTSLSKHNGFNLDMVLTPFIGTARRTMLNDNQRGELIRSNTLNGEEVFSYAFVRTASRPENFSYTIMK